MTWSLRVPNLFPNKVISGCGVAVVLLLCFLSLLLHHPLRGLHAYVVLSGSMKPSIGAGSVVLTVTEPPNLYMPGMIVAFRPPPNPRETVIHRITTIQPNRNAVLEVSTKGDANTNGDPWVLTLGAISGRVIVHIPWLGYVLHLIATPLGLFLVALISFFGLVAGELQFLSSAIQQLFRKKK